MGYPHAFGTTAPLVREMFPSFIVLGILSDSVVALSLQDCLVAGTEEIEPKNKKQIKQKNQQKIDIFPHCFCRVFFMLFLIIITRLIMNFFFSDCTWCTDTGFGLTLSSGWKNQSGGGKQRRLVLLVAF